MATHPGQDWAGADLTLAGGDVIYGTHTSIGLLSIPLGATVTVLPYDSLVFGSGGVELQCHTANILGTLDASGAGYPGGGGGGGSLGAVGGTGFSGSGTGDSRDTSTLTGGGGGAGAGVYGGVGGAVSAAANPGNKGLPGGYAHVYSVTNHDTSTDLAVAMGSGGGGGGAGAIYGSPVDSTMAGGGGGGAGAYGGGVVKILATVIEIPGSVLSRDRDSGDGGRGYALHSGGSWWFARGGGGGGVYPSAGGAGWSIDGVSGGTGTNTGTSKGGDAVYDETGGTLSAPGGVKDNPGSTYSDLAHYLYSGGGGGSGAGGGCLLSIVSQGAQIVCGERLRVMRVIDTRGGLGTTADDNGGTVKISTPVSVIGGTISSGRTLVVNSVLGAIAG